VKIYKFKELTNERKHDHFLQIVLQKFIWCDSPDSLNDENSNLEVSKFGEKTNFDFVPKSHYEIGLNLKMLDFDLATKTTGSRFVFVKDKLALLERAITNFMLDVHTKTNGYREISPPLMASDSAMFSAIL
jgi:seryl-tRNA synthetase